MQPISDMPGDDFMKLQSLYAADLPINAECTLEDARQVLNWLLFESPKDGRPNVCAMFWTGCYSS